LARMTRKRSRTAMVSGGLEPVLDSGGGGHSVFAKAFLAALEEKDWVRKYWGQVSHYHIRAA